ncbi:Ig-like domain-containing protein [Lawsonibacter faecis]|uniref:Ig domain-containing protein n=1 Tax=Lawsonibacter faecis TaxID=2763052 RepID=A0A8J6JMG6_9FIRM|nr:MULTISPECIES: Ig-like domain-containing protein [Oscillospiraceae]MTQ97605.1 Ig-like domain-containing surface protein [Pseudoflavonifractor sp. BIOML-A16]MTR07813.1 Ig-like domain-containing surface protein [Pseudoflavonifractor sp. BIOML-A15]MTR31768.1 Ig-like domain-containing surface protein [Pseudoflavonifractor sp. BIOML-A14]MTR73523.1 Ig-like domain-containing surface protein [Pseudoflavonifractor sp. BIOML-A18]MTS65962.1 Ig-like domain-containing surface protein [Pseudoflavonifracto
MKKQLGKQILSLALAGAMVTSMAATAAPTLAKDAALEKSVAYQPIELEAAPTKIMDYLSIQDPAGVDWVTDSEALAFLPAAAIGDVTCAVQATDRAVWVGTKNGLMRMDFNEKDPRDMVQYFAGNRYLYNGDDHVTGLAADDDCGVWVRNAAGSVHIRMPKMTLEDRTYFYEKMVNDVNDRRGMVTDSNRYTYDPATGEYTQSFAGTNDNDGLWTAMYAMGEILRYQALKKEGAPSHEIAAAKAAATRATKAVLLLDYVSGRGNGFPCRSYLLTSEAEAQSGANGLQTDGFWFGIEMLDAGESYPDPIIDELTLEGKTPIGIATVRPTRDALQKRGSQIFPQDTDFNGLGLSQSTIDRFNEARPDGQKLGTDIVSNNSNQVFPLMVRGINNKLGFVEPTADHPVKEEDILFQLTAPVYEQIPTIFNDLFPDSAIVDGHVDMEQIVYKADTSSDEVDGHYALFLTAYRYLCDEGSDKELRKYVAEACLRMTDLILKDDRYYIVDATGKSTQWSRWLSRYFNDSIDVMKAQEGWSLYRIGVDENGEDQLSYGYEDASLNALEVMAALKTAAYIAEAEGDPRAEVYATAYSQCFESPYSGGGVPNDPNSYVNGKGYIEMALEHIPRRIIRQNTDAYGENGNKPVTEYTPGKKIFNNALHEDWTQYVNYSDEELGWFPVYSLITLEEDEARHSKIVDAYDLWYDGQEEREENPFYTFLYQLAHPEKSDVDLQSAVRYFYRSPLLRNNQMHARGDRQDVLYIEAGNRDSRAQTNYALPLDEMNIGKDNGNPFARYNGYGPQTGSPYTSGSLDCCTVFTLPYWLGRFYGIIEETESDYYTRVAPDAFIDTSTADIVSVTVTDNGTPLERMIVDFYEDGSYIGRTRTDASGKAALIHTVKGNITATVTERLVGRTMYDQVDARTLTLRLSVPANMEMVVGEHHSLDFVMLPETNKERGLIWSSSDESVATVDRWGRVTAVGAGNVVITATAKIDTEEIDTAEIKVVATTDDLTKISHKDIVTYTEDAAEEVQNLQKYVDRYTKAEALGDADVPQTVKDVLAPPAAPAAEGEVLVEEEAPTEGEALFEGAAPIEDTMPKADIQPLAGRFEEAITAASTAPVSDGAVTWSVESYGIQRIDDDPAHQRDAKQFFMGNRYLPEGNIIHIESDGSNGLWVVSDSADATAVTHIRMVELSYTDKAAEMSRTTQDIIARRGMVSEANWSGTEWIPTETDNDGLWTSMYGAGELMRYSVLKNAPGATEDEIAAARETALNSIKSVLLLSNITCRTGDVDAYIRPLKNESNQYLYYDKFEGLALLKGKDFSINAPQSGPAGATARVEDPDLMAPFFPDDWAPVTESSDKEDFETRARTLEGMIARTYCLDGEYPGRDFNDGYYWDIEGDTATCVESTSEKVKWEKLVFQTVDASGHIPAAVADLLGNATKDNIIYKTDTSTDEIIGHLFIYKIAYDILDEYNPEEKEVKELLVDTVRRFARHMADNGYSLRDATGQATTWGKTERDYFNNAYAWEDCALNSLVNLCTFKLAAYVTGEARWEEEYRMLALDEPYRYADLAGEYWERWEHLAHVDGKLDENASQAEINTWIQQNLNYSDEEMAMLAYYILFQMEADESILKKYQVGLNAWWNSIQYSENPLWYYIYQLAYPNEEMFDAYGNALVDTAAWALSRHPIDTIKWCASNNSRPDVEQDEGLSRDKTTGEIRVVPFDERAIHKYNGSTYRLNDDDSNQMESSTTYTLPYWMGRYHGMIVPMEDVLT